MSTIGVLLITLMLCMIANIGNGFQCFSGTCSNSTGGGPGSSCPPAEKLTCGKMEGTDIDLDRCITQRVKMQMFGQTVYQQIRNCSHSMQCTPAMRDIMCNAANTTGSVVSCEMGCCEGDLCNDGHAIPTFPPPGPSGPDLDCYSCSSMPMPGISVAQQSCSNPTKQNCGGDGMIPNIAQDRCITIKLSMGMYGSHEIRNCSSQYFCSSDMMCKSMNTSGMLTRCDVSCCSGKYCNGADPPTVATTTAVHPSGNTDSSTVMTRAAAGTLSNARAMLVVLFVMALALIYTM